VNIAIAPSGAFGRVREGEHRVHAPDHAAHGELGQRRRQREQAAQQRVALDHREPARHVQAGGRNWRHAGEVERVVLAHPQGHAAAERVARHHRPRARVLRRGAGEGVELSRMGWSRCRRSAAPKPGKSTAVARRSARPRAASTGRQVSAESA
jgi:hypothetical protein